MDVPGARLESANEEVLEVILEEDFEESRLDRDAGAWHIVSTPTNPGIHTDGTISHQIRTEGTAHFLRLGGVRGLAVRLVSVEANSTYRFVGELRAQGLVPQTTPFHGATYWLAELDSAESFEKIVADGQFEQHILKRHFLPIAVGETDWVPRSSIFRTQGETKALLIGCALGTSEDVKEGTVDFRGVRLERAPDTLLWDAMARRASMAKSGTRHQDWRAQRSISADLRAELRPSIVLLPGESLVFRLALQEHAPILETGLGIWRSVLLESSRPSSAIEISIGDVVVYERELTSTASPLGNRWEEQRVDLKRWAAQTVELTFRCRGQTPLVLGAPCLRSADQRAERPNVILISIDMLRADHVGAYGYGRGTTPNLDRLAEENLFFPSMHAQAAYTLPATVSLFSGQFASVHGVYRGTQAVSQARSPALAEILGREGYRTQGFTAGGFVSADFGLDTGFDGFTNVDPLRHDDSDFFHLLRDRNPELTPELVAEHGPERIATWLDEHHDETFFLFLHTYTVHDYDAPDGWLLCEKLGCTSTRTDFSNFLPHVESNETISEADRAHLRHRYDGSLRYVDSLLGDLFAQLQELGIEENTILVITSDHGEEMFERGVIQHGKTLYEELTRIPLIMRVPGQGKRTIEKPVMTIDVTPTVLHALGVPRDPRMQGEDILSKDLETRPVIAEIDDHFAHKYSIRDGQGFKLIYSPRESDVLFPGEKEWELFDTKADPGEGNDLSGSMEERVRVLRGALLEELRRFKELGARLGDVDAADVTEETQQALDALGY